MNTTQLISVIATAIAAFLLSLLFTPAVRVLAIKIGAVDVPKDDRRMHNTPMPLIGGLAIFLSFVLVALIFVEPSPMLTTIMVGGFALIVIGVIDDIFAVNAVIKLIVHIAASLLAIYEGVIIENINIFGRTIEFGVMSYPVTILWIVALINAFNLIDGLDGLSCGVCSISCFSLFIISTTMNSPVCSLLAVILFGACVGFLPYNFHPAKIFMGDTGAYFLGFVLAIISIEGLFKISTIISFILPVTIFALPLVDTAFAFLRRLFGGKNPFSPDKRHLHHRLIAMGLSQKETVLTLYAISTLFGVIAIIHTDVLFAENKLYKVSILITVAVVVCIINYALLRCGSFGGKAGNDKSDNDNNNDDTGDSQ